MASRPPRCSHWREGIDVNPAAAKVFPVIYPQMAVAAKQQRVVDPVAIGIHHGAPAIYPDTPLLLPCGTYFGSTFNVVCLRVLSCNLQIIDDKPRSGLSVHMLRGTPYFGCSRQPQLF